MQVFCLMQCKSFAFRQTYHHPFIMLNFSLYQPEKTFPNRHICQMMSMDTYAIELISLSGVVFHHICVQLSPLDELIGCCDKSLQ